MKITLTLTLFLLIITSYSTAQNYVIDNDHSSVQIQIERFGVIDVVGRFKNIAGQISYNPEDTTKTNASATIQVESYDANSVGGEEAVKSKVFLDAATYPEITFKSSKTILKEGKNYLIGILTIHGVSNEIELPFSIKGPLLDLPTQKQSIAFLASTTINRQDYGINFDRKLSSGVSIIGNDVNINLIVLALAQ